MSGGSGPNIILIGMPGAGKSTIGPLLSQRLGMAYADTDDIVRERQGEELKNIVRDHGFAYFLEVQEQAIMSLGLSNYVLATGGSVVKSPLLMQSLKQSGRVVYLRIGYGTFERRLAPGRRLARNGGQSLREMYDERTPLYLKYADLILDCEGKSVEAVVDEILEDMGRSGGF